MYLKSVSWPGFNQSDHETKRLIEKHLIRKETYGPLYPDRILPYILNSESWWPPSRLYIQAIPEDLHN